MYKYFAFIMLAITVQAANVAVTVDTADRGVAQELHLSNVNNEYAGDGSGIFGLTTDADDSTTTNFQQVVTIKGSLILTNAATVAQGANADTAFGWGDHSVAGYLTGFPEIDPFWVAVSNTVTANALLGSTALQNVVEDATPELGGSLNAAVNTITNVLSLGFADGSSLYSTWLGPTCTVHFVSPSAIYTTELILIAE
tara:strand:- start:2693 stop:3286 length:594 start_codon:yes stop_codon:yes gene_type:complete